MSIHDKIDCYASNSYLDVAVILYEYTQNNNYSLQSKKNYSKRLLRWIRKHNIPIEKIVESYLR